MLGGSDFAEEGRNAGHSLEKYLESRRAGRQFISYLQGTLGSSAQIGRTEHSQRFSSRRKLGDAGAPMGEFIARGRRL